jgi:transcriptional regulator with XRE-family HTH domain
MARNFLRWLRRILQVSRRLAEVAKQVGVSEATVSRVLNEKPGVSEATRQTVLTALDVLGYERPSKLRGERARLIGLFLPELGNPIFPAFGELVGGGLAQNGYTPVLCTQSAGSCSSRCPVWCSSGASTRNETLRTTTTRASRACESPRSS